jgi:hypothetical protein
VRIELALSCQAVYLSLKFYKRKWMTFQHFRYLVCLTTGSIACSEAGPPQTAI